MRSRSVCSIETDSPFNCRPATCALLLHNGLSIRKITRSLEMLLWVSSYQSSANVRGRLKPSAYRSLIRNCYLDMLQTVSGGPRNIAVCSQRRLMWKHKSVISMLICGSDHRAIITKPPRMAPKSGTFTEQVQSLSILYIYVYLAKCRLVNKNQLVYIYLASSRGPRTHPRTRKHVFYMTSAGRQIMIKRSISFYNFLSLWKLSEKDIVF